MKIKIGDFCIKEEEFSYVVWDHTLEKPVKGGEMSKPGAIYPNTLYKALIRVRDRMRAKKTGSVDVDSYVEKIKKIDEQFFSELNLLLKDLETYSKLK